MKTRTVEVLIIAACAIGFLLSVPLATELVFRILGNSSHDFGVIISCAIITALTASMVSRHIILAPIIAVGGPTLLFFGYLLGSDIYVNRTMPGTCIYSITSDPSDILQILKTGAQWTLFVTGTVLVGMVLAFGLKRLSRKSMDREELIQKCIPEEIRKVNAHNERI